MTTDTELRDLLAAEAGGPTGRSGGWEDVMRRGRHRQRARRMQNLALVAVVAGVTVTAITLSTEDVKVDTTPATEPVPTAPEEIDPSTVLQGDDVRIHAARSQGDSVKLFFWFVPNVCDLRPLVVEADDQVSVGLVDEQDERGVSWTSCGDASSGNFGSIELRGPLADRPIVDVSTGRTVPVTDSDALLFPTSLPAPFDLEVFVEGNGLTDRIDPVRESTTFRFTADNGQSLSLASSTKLDDNGSGCDAGQTVEVRGTEGCFTIDDATYIADGEVHEISFPPGSARGSLAWDENGRSLYLSIVMVGAGDSALDELLAIAEGLEALSG